MNAADSHLVIVGRISGFYGVKGWVKIFSYTMPRTNILSYSPWQVCVDGEWQTIEVMEGRDHGKGVIAHLVGYDDRDSIGSLIGADIAVNRQQLPAIAEGEYYWADLIGLRVATIDGVELGKVDRLIATGANDVLVVKGDKDRLIPFVSDEVVVKIDTQSRVITVDWDPDF
jgi:16S rRNA processing protein RimM